MVSSSSNFVIVFNGEIYNFLELMAELQQLGHIFRGHSDTEVMLAAFEIWGVRAAVERFRGMFAFAVYDKVAEQLWLARDRMGEKPLYLFCDGGDLFFASELRSLLAGLSRKLSLDWQGISEYFRYGYFSPQATPFAQIKKLPPATILCLSYSQRQNLTSTLQLLAGAEVYWQAPNSTVLELSEQQALNQFRSLIESAVEQQIVADVDVGVFLSGGIDSSLVAAVAQARSSQPIRTFTIAFDHQAYNEGPFAQQIAQHLGANHTQIDLSMAACVDAIEDLPRLMDEPFADASLIPTYLVSRAARQHVTVCLSGDGGDELFAGYNRYRWGERIWFSVKTIPKPLRLLASKTLLGVPSRWYDAAYYFVAAVIRASGRQPEKDLGAKIHKIGRVLAAANGKYVYADLLSFWYASPLNVKIESGIGALAEFDEARFDDDFVEAAMNCDRQFYLPCDNLFKVDRAAMANSLEVRLPLLDHRIVEFTAELGRKFKLNGQTTKCLMRTLLYEYVPKAMIERPKMGFSMPLADWLRGPLYQWAVELLGDTELLVSSRLIPGVVEKTWREHQAGQADNANAIWTVLAYLLWTRANKAFINFDQAPA